MTIEEKKEKLNNFCSRTVCSLCPLNGTGGWSVPCNVGCLRVNYSPESDLDRAIEIIENASNDKPAVDPVNRPAHYTDGNIEVIDFIEDKKLGFCLGNAIKYIARAGKKDSSKEIEDLRKSVWYIERRIKELEEVSP